MVLTENVHSNVKFSFMKKKKLEEMKDVLLRCFVSFDVNALAGRHAKVRQTAR